MCRRRLCRRCLPCVRSSTRPSRAGPTRRCRVCLQPPAASHSLKSFEGSKLCVPHAEALVSRYVDGLRSPQVLTCRGSALALASLPRFMIRGKLEQVTPPHPAVLSPCCVCAGIMSCVCVCVRSWEASSRRASGRMRRVSSRPNETQSKLLLSEITAAVFPTLSSVSSDPPSPH